MTTRKSSLESHKELGI